MLSICDGATDATQLAVAGAQQDVTVDDALLELMPGTGRWLRDTDPVVLALFTDRAVVSRVDRCSWLRRAGTRGQYRLASALTSDVRRPCLSFGGHRPRRQRGAYWHVQRVARLPEACGAQAERPDKQRPNLPRPRTTKGTAAAAPGRDRAWRG